MNVRSAASRQARIAPAANFTGAVFQDPLARAEGPSKTNATTVTFVPGARTVWHTHDMRQVLVVTTGLGLLQVRGESAQALRPGDVATVPPGIDHWHGAAMNSLFGHISLLESTPEGTTWGQSVTEDDYAKANTDIGSS
ncbi:cupin domain-containing protein [Rhodopila sp.]|uniref:cupin domain-containing protein n=1 Tax=Rhodopila sp. TaxID=2480087 RepID=UPI003D10E551